jgi:hypothetical protein
MMMEPTLEKMRLLKLNAMATAWLAQRADTAVHDLDFDARLSLIVEAEILARDNKRLQKLLRRQVADPQRMHRRPRLLPQA